MGRALRLRLLTCRRSQHGGFTLIEVLISLLVLGVGVIGVAGMQLHALHTTQQSGFRTAALHIAADIADSIRARSVLDKSGERMGAYFEIDSSFTPTSPASSSGASDDQCLGSTANCSPDALISADVRDWAQQINTALPGGRAVICRDSTPWNSLSRKFSWNCDGAPDASIVIKIGWHEKRLGKEAGLPSDADTPAVVLAVTPSRT